VGQDQEFETTFMASKDHLEELIEAKTVTINRLLEICPSGTIDPTPYLYDQALMVMGALGVGALVTNALLHPMDPSSHEGFEGLDMDKDERLDVDELGSARVVRALDKDGDGVVNKEEFEKKHK
jgi:hypothetical protein